MDAGLENTPADVALHIWGGFQSTSCHSRHRRYDDRSQGPTRSRCSTRSGLKTSGANGPLGGQEYKPSWSHPRAIQKPSAGHPEPILNHAGASWRHLRAIKPHASSSSLSNLADSLRLSMQTRPGGHASDPQGSHVSRTGCGHVHVVICVL